jgi:hypothetical protein
MNVRFNNYEYIYNLHIQCGQSTQYEINFLSVIGGTTPSTTQIVG